MESGLGCGVLGFWGFGVLKFWGFGEGDKRGGGERGMELEIGLDWGGLVMMVVMVMVVVMVVVSIAMNGMEWMISISLN